MSILKIKIYLKSEDKSDMKPVIFKLSFGYKEIDLISGKVTYKPLFYNSGVKVYSNEWNSKMSLPTNRKHTAVLLEVEEAIKNTYENLKLKGATITPKVLSKELDKILGRDVEDVETIKICDYIENKIEHNTKRSLVTRKQYRTLKNHLRTFEENKNIVLDTSNFQRSLYLEFMSKMREQLNTINSVWKIQKNLKSTLNEIRREYDIKVFNLTAELSSGEKAQMVDENQIYLNFHQIQELIEFDPEEEKIKNVKFILLTLLLTGCRYSDVFKISFDLPPNEKEASFPYSRFITEKGKGTEVIVPLFKPLLKLYEQNDFNPPYPITNQKFNQYVKDLMKAANFQDEIRLAYTDSKGNKIFKTRKLFELVTSHIGRRSFITNLINYIPITALCKITGHKLKDRSIIFKYNKISLLENAKVFTMELKRAMQTYPSEFPLELL